MSNKSISTIRKGKLQCTTYPHCARVLHLCGSAPQALNNAHVLLMLVTCMAVVTKFRRKTRRQPRRPMIARVGRESEREGIILKGDQPTARPSKQWLRTRQLDLEAGLPCNHKYCEPQCHWGKRQAATRPQSRPRIACIAAKSGEDCVM